MKVPFSSTVLRYFVTAPKTLPADVLLNFRSVILLSLGYFATGVRKKRNVCNPLRLIWKYENKSREKTLGFRILDIQSFYFISSWFKRNELFSTSFDKMKITMKL